MTVVLVTGGFGSLGTAIAGQQVVSAVLDRHGRLDALVNAAGGLGLA